MLKNKLWIWAAALAVFLAADALLLLSVLTAPRSISAALLPTAQYLEQNPAPTPEFIERVEVAPCWNIALCLTVAIREQPFARIGTNSDELSNFMSENATIRIDGYPITKFSSHANMFACDSSVLSTVSQMICWGIGLSFHVDISKITPGLHIAEIILTDLDRIEHTYSWAFRYEPNFPTSDPNILPTLARLPTETPTP